MVVIFVATPLTAVATPALATSSVTIESPTDGSTVAPGPVDVTGRLDRVGPAPGGGSTPTTQTLWLVGDGRSVTFTDPFDETNWGMSSAGHGNQQTWFDVVGAWDARADENSPLPTFITAETVAFDGSPALLRIFVDDGDPARKVGPNCPWQAQLFEADGTLLGPSADSISPSAGVGFGFGPWLEVQFSLAPPAGTYAGLKLQVGVAFLNCVGPKTTSWGTDEVPARLEWTTGGGGPGTGEGTASLFVDAESSPRGQVAVVVGDDAIAPFSIPADLSDLSGGHTLTVAWSEADGTPIDSDDVTVTVEPSGEDTILITSPEDGSTVEPGPSAVSGSVARAGGAAGPQTSATLPRLGALGRLGEGTEAIAFVDASDVVDVTPEGATGTQAARTGPPVPAPSDGLGPGAPVLAYANGLVGVCTANYVWKDQNDDYYLGAAGHCFFLGSDDTKVATHGAGADMPDTSHITVLACVATCAFGGANLLADGATGNNIGRAVGDLVTLGPVAYARQGPQDFGQDFGLVRIPEALEPLIRPEMPVWNGPVGMWTPPTTDAEILGNPTFVYGNGVGFGETFLGKARTGTLSFAIDDYPGAWVSDTPASQGDSGSAVNFGARTSTSEFVESRDAMGILTHLFGHPVTAGTMVQKAISMTTEAGLAIDFLREGDTVGGGGGGGGPPVPETRYAHQTDCPGTQWMDPTDSAGDNDDACFLLAATGETLGLGELGVFPATDATRGANAADAVQASVFVTYDETPASVSTVTSVLRADGIEVGRGSHQQIIDPLTWFQFGWVRYDMEFELGFGFPEGAALTWEVYHEGSARAMMGFEAEHASHLTVESTVAPPNEPPVADAGADQTVTEGDEVALAGSCSDPDGNLASCAWSQVSGPAVLIVDNMDGTASFTAPEVESDRDVVVRLTATDAEGESHSDDATVTVRATEPGQEHVEVWIAGEQAGPDLPVGPTDASNPTASWTADVDFAAYEGQTVTVEARWVEADGTLLDSDTVLVNVRSSNNEAPTAEIQGPDRAKAGTPVTFDGSGSSDPDGAIVDWTWDMGDGTVLHGEIVEHTYHQPGAKTIRLTVTDDEGATGTATFRHVVQGPPG